MLCRAHSIFGIGLTSFAAALGCSAPAGESELTTPGALIPFPGSSVPTGTAPGVDPQGGGGTNASGGTGNTTEGIGGNVPVSGTGGSGATNPQNGMGGSAGTPTTPGEGAGGSAGTSAAGSGNAPVEPPPGPVGTGCAPGAAFFCEDFEDFAVGTAQQNPLWRPEGTVTIDGQTVQGTRSLRVQANAGQASRIFVNGFAPPNNSFFGRMNVFVQSFPTAPNYAHYVLVEVTGNGGERVRPIGGQLIQDQNVGNVWGVGSDGGATGDWTAWRATAPAVGARWQCMEWQMDDSDNSVDVHIDGTLKSELSVSTNSHDGNGAFNFPTFNNIWLGWTVFQGGSVPAPFVVYLDDIVLSSERVGCP